MHWKIPDCRGFIPVYRGLARLRAIVVGMMDKKVIGRGVMISSGCTISRAARLDIGQNTWIKENVEIGGFVIIGSNVIIGCRTRIDGKGRVLIGSNTHIGRDVDIYSHRHILDDPETMVNNSKEELEQTSVGTNVMVYEKCGIMAGGSR